MAVYGLMQQRAGTVRRVIRRGAWFICGMCRRPHDDEAEAHSCVVDCWTELLQLDPVIVRKVALSLHYRCRFCARDYLAAGDARTCARACREQILEAFASEDEIYRSGDDGPRMSRYQPKPKLQPPLPVQAPPRMRTPAASAPAVTAPVAPASRTSPAPAASPSPAPAQAAAPASAPAAAEAAGKGYKDADVFMRDGARYICKVCKKKHFTRDDVVRCFESHEGAAPPA